MLNNILLVIYAQSESLNWKNLHAFFKMISLFLAHLFIEYMFVARDSTMYYYGILKDFLLDDMIKHGETRSNHKLFKRKNVYSKLDNHSFPLKWRKRKARKKKRKEIGACFESYLFMLYTAFRLDRREMKQNGISCEELDFSLFKLEGYASKN